MKSRIHTLLSLRATLSLGLLCMVLGIARADEVAGTVRDELGNPIVGADFNVYDAETGAKLAPSDNTDAAGKYRLLVDPGKRYDFLCQPGINSGFAPRIVRALLVNGPVTLDFVLPPSAQARGRVTDSRNPDTGTNGVYPCDLDFDRVDDGSRQPALGDLTSPFGTFVSYLEGGAYNVTATPADTALAPARVFGWTLPTTDILQMPLQPAAFVAGTIRDSNGAPVAGATLKFDDTAAGRRLPSTKSTSDANGFIRMGVTPGVYRVTVEPASGTPYAAIRVADVDLTASRFMDFTVAVGAIVSGSVTDRLGRPVGQADWDAILESGAGAATPNDNTGFDGRYRYVVAPGIYRLRLTPPVSTGLDSVVLRNVAITRDTTINVDYAALSGGGSGDSPVIRFAPQGNPTHTRANLTLVLNQSVTSGLVEVYDVSGRRVRVLADGPMAAGTNPLAWDGRHDNGAQAHTGVYLVRARLDGHEQVTRFVLLP